MISAQLCMFVPLIQAVQSPCYISKSYTGQRCPVMVPFTIGWNGLAYGRFTRRGTLRWMQTEIDKVCPVRFMSLSPIRHMPKFLPYQSYLCKYIITYPNDRFPCLKLRAIYRLHHGSPSFFIVFYVRIESFMHPVRNSCCGEHSRSCISNPRQVCSLSWKPFKLSHGKTSVIFLLV